MIKENENYIYLNDRYIPVTREVYLEWYRLIWRIHDYMTNHNACSCPQWWICQGDCGVCRFRIQGDIESFDEKKIAPTNTCSAYGRDPADVVIEKMELEEILNELKRIDPDGARMAILLEQGLTNREVAEVIGIPRSTFSRRKLKLRSGLKKYLQKRNLNFSQKSGTNRPLISNTS